MEEIIQGLLDPVIIGTVAIFVLVTVQGLKVFGVINVGNEGKAALITAAVVGAALAAGLVYPPIQGYITLALQVYIGTVVGGLGYKYIAKPVLENFAGNISAEDL